MTRMYFLIVFMVICITLFLFFHVGVEKDTVYSQQTEVYTRHLIRAVKAAVSSNEYEKDGQMIYLFNDEEKRQKAVNLFFHTLEQGLNYVYDSNYKDELKMHVSVLALIDTDGYYIVYNAPYHIGDGSIAFKSTITPINTWSATSKNNAYYIRYYLSDYVEVYDVHADKYVSGNYAKVYSELEQPVGLEDFTSKENFQTAKNDTIIQEIQNNIEHYINEYNFAVNSYSKTGIRTEYDLHYNFTLPQVPYEDWCGLIKKPSSIAFFQGIQMPDTDQYLNIFAMGGGEIIENKGYYINEIDGECIYHLENCSLLNDSDCMYRMTREECAKQGIFPCDKCNP